MQFFRILLLLFSGSVLLVESGLEVKEHQACYGTASAMDCSQHHLQCQHGSSIFFTQALRGFKPQSTSCPHDRDNCLNVNSCCRYIAGDCSEVYTQEAFSDLAAECWNQQACYYTVPYVRRDICNNNYRPTSRYSKVHYLCLPDLAILDFNDTRGTTASRLALRYTSSYESKYYTCLVEANDCTSLPVEVVLYERHTVTNADFCVIFPADKGSLVLCSKNSTQYTTFRRITPFSVELLVLKNRDDAQAWILIHSNTSRTVRVMCKPWEDRSPFPECSSTTASWPSSETTPATERQTDIHSSSSPAVGANPDVTAESLPQSANTSSSTAGIVGGVLGVVVLLLVVALVMTVVLLKRRSPQEMKASDVVAWFKGGNSNSKNARAGGSSDSGRAKLHMTSAQPTSLSVFDNSAATISDEAGVRVDPDSDYNHLGQKPASSASRDVTYGHLADGSDVTDYGYDHVAKGKPAVRSGDVINNVYNTAGTATGAASDEDFYNSTGGAKNRPDVINNVYNAPGSATEAGCDVDYYNVTGVPLATRDVTNNDYGTPKSGSHVASPYELARNVK